MNITGKILGVAGLLLILIPTLLMLADVISNDQNKIFILTGTIVWFIGAPLALNGKAIR